MIEVFDMSRRAREQQPGYENDGIIDVALLSLSVVANILSSLGRGAF